MFRNYETQTEKVISALETLDNTQLQERLANQTLTETHKTIMLETINTAVLNLKKNITINYKDFIPLFTCVQNLKTLNIHDYPSWDSFWRIHHTPSLFTALSYVRAGALEVIKAEINTIIWKNEKILFIQEAEKLDLFKLPRTNWPIKSPTSLSELQSLMPYIPITLSDGDGMGAFP